MRRCPRCNRIYPLGDTYNFCHTDGTNLITGETALEAPTLEGSPVDCPTVKVHSQKVKNPSALEKAAKLTRKLEIEELRGDLYQGKEAVKFAQQAVEALMTHIEEQVQEVRENFPRVQIMFLASKGRDDVTIFGHGYDVKLFWHQPYIDSLNKSRLTIVEHRPPAVPGDEPLEHSRYFFVFNVNDDYVTGWKEEGDSRFVTSEDLAGECVNRLLHMLLTRPE